MLRIVLDTNIYISAIIFGGKPEPIIDLARMGKIELLVSSPILREIERILQEKLNQSRDRVTQALSEIQSIATRVVPSDTLSIIKDDEPDNRILECAFSGQADLIISGDRKHILPLREIRGIKVVSAADFLNIFSI